MSTPAAADLHPCECGCGELVQRRFARGHHLRKRRLTALPGPDVPDDELDMGLLEPESFNLGEVGAPVPPAGWGHDGLPPTGRQDAEEILEPDRPPGHLSAPAGGRQRASEHRTGPIRVNATVRKDIAAKIKMPLYLGGKVWEARDPWCGGTFVAQLDPIVNAFTDIVCDSADLVAFFTGPAGGFMKYLNLAAAVAPVAQVAYAHHVTHRVGGEKGQPAQPDMARYAA